MGKILIIAILFCNGLYLNAQDVLHISRIEVEDLKGKLIDSMPASGYIVLHTDSIEILDKDARQLDIFRICEEQVLDRTTEFKTVRNDKERCKLIHRHSKDSFILCFPNKQTKRTTVYVCNI